MSLYQIWFSINEPNFTEEQIVIYQSLISNFYIIGNTVNNRELVRCLMTKEAIDQGQAWLTALGKEPIICDVRDIDGIRYGFQVLDNMILPIEGLIPYPMNEFEHDLYMGEGATENTSAGWASWFGRL
jgi:hypothetical protein